MKRRVFTKKAVNALVRKLSVAHRDYGQLVGLNVKIYNFPNPIKDILYKGFGLSQTLWGGDIIFTIFRDVEMDIKEILNVNLYTFGRTGGYWGFAIPELEREGISEKKAISTLRKSLASALYDVFYNITNESGEVDVFNLGYDFNKSDYIFLSIRAKVVNGDIKLEADLDGLDSWKAVQPAINKFLGEENFSAVKGIFNSFTTCHELCSVA